MPKIYTRNQESQEPLMKKMVSSIITDISVLKVPNLDAGFFAVPRRSVCKDGPCLGVAFAKTDCLSMFSKNCSFFV